MAGTLAWCRSVGSAPYLSQERNISPLLSSNDLSIIALTNEVILDSSQEFYSSSC